jgi:two-component system phosphate regulon sensor histidine kinase PhoR
MNKKAIWAIIGVMSAAVIGVVWLQMDLIRTSMKVNERKFDKDVYSALNNVALRLEYEEKREAFNRNMNGFVANYFEREIDGLEPEAPAAPAPPPKPDGFIGGELIDQLMSEFSDTCTCYHCLKSRDDKFRRVMVYNMRSDYIPLDERVNVRQLGEMLKQELNNRGIDASYNFGVFSNEKQSFVMVDDHYVIDDPTSGGAVIPVFKAILDSPYKVTLFNQDMPSPGTLMIHFPYRSSVLWSSLWKNFLGTIVFTSIILLCFGYTIHVIIMQKKLSEMKTDFINNMTHEFKTPIATISLAADSITNPIISGNPDKVSRFANIIKQENKRMNSQVEKVLQMALLDKREFSLKTSAVNLHEVIYAAIENIGLQVEKRDGAAKAILEATEPVVEGDMTHISNIINNLLDNANKYSPDKPEITVHTRNVANGVQVTVEDKGIGLSKEARKQIFDKFYRVHTGNLHDVKGFGLGLSYVKAMMTAHKGQVDVKSEPGKGSSFILFFPFHLN